MVIATHGEHFCVYFTTVFVTMHVSDYTQERPALKQINFHKSAVEKFRKLSVMQNSTEEKHC